MKSCSMCYEDIEDANGIFNSVKGDIPKSKHYIFDDYAKGENKRNICLGCYIKTVIMFQKIAVT